MGFKIKKLSGQMLRFHMSIKFRVKKLQKMSIKVYLHLKISKKRKRRDRFLMIFRKD